MQRSPPLTKKGYAGSLALVETRERIAARMIESHTGAAEPLALTVKLPDEPTVNVALATVVKAGA